MSQSLPLNDIGLSGKRKVVPPRTARPAQPATVIGPAMMRPGIAISLLLLAALLWGSGNVANKTLLAHIGPLTAICLRALVASLVLLPLLRLDGPGTPGAGWMKSAICVSALYIMAATIQQAAYVWTTVTNASFLVNTCAVITPLLAWAIFRQRPGVPVTVAAIMTLLGAFLMSGLSPATLSINIGDLACIAAAVCYAGWAIALGRHAMRHGRPFTLTALQFALAFVVTGPAAIVIEAPTTAQMIAAVPEILYLAVFSTAGACTLTAIAQRHVSPSLAVVLLSMESVFGAGAARLLLGEVTTMAGLAGGLLIAMGVIVAVRPISRRDSGTIES
jgi:drug/metabolite transporter (DMT)-like permease